jgi:MFS transporter, putative metabolite:H+ symporter
MAAETQTFDVLERQERLTRNQWIVVGSAALGGMLEFLDGYIIAFVLAFIIGPWKLQYGQAAVVLMSSGVGSLLGSCIWGQLADHIGRRATFAATILTCSLASLALALTPEGDWIKLTVLRFIVGVGIGGFFVPMMLVQEFLPLRRRGQACGLVSAVTAGGLVLGALSGSFLAPLLGWRGMFLVGALPVFFGVAVLFLIHESPHWALAKGRADLARNSLRWALPPGVAPELPAGVKQTAPQSWREVFRHPRSVLNGTLINLGVVTGYYGMVLWSPTLLSQIQGVPGEHAAKLMVGMSLAGLISRFIVGALSDRLGRRACGAVVGFLTGVMLVCAGLVGHGDLLGPRFFWLPLALSFVFADASVAVLGAYTSEIWPAPVRGRGSGLSYAAGGLGKIIGPLGFALLIGSSNVVRPMATVDALVASFAYLAAMFAVAGLVYALIGIDARAQAGAGVPCYDRIA